MTASVWLSLGSNKGDRQGYLVLALRRLAEHPQIKLAKISSLYITEPWGVSGQEDYYNAVVNIYTTLQPQALLDYTQSIENESGRVRTERWGARELDIDIILYNNLCQTDERLILPHPRFAQRMFVLQPLWEIAGDIQLPYDKTLSQIIAACQDEQKVELLLAPQQWAGEVWHYVDHQ